MPVQVEYEVVNDPPSHRLYPVDIIAVMHRGQNLIHSLHVGQISTVQRRVYNRLIDSGEIDLPANKIGLT